MLHRYDAYHTTFCLKLLKILFPRILLLLLLAFFLTTMHFNTNLISISSPKTYAHSPTLPVFSPLFIFEYLKVLEWVYVMHIF